MVTGQPGVGTPRSCTQIIRTSGVRRCSPRGRRSSYAIVTAVRAVVLKERCQTTRDGRTPTAVTAPRGPGAARAGTRLTARARGIDKMKAPSQIPAVTHVDYRARADGGRRAAWPLLRSRETFGEAGCRDHQHQLNVRGEPSLNTPEQRIAAQATNYRRAERFVRVKTSSSVAQFRRTSNLRVSPT